jgi:hypothetical protein
VVCHRDNVEKVQIIIAFLFLVLQAQYPKLNVDGPFYPEKVTALKSTYILGGPKPMCLFISKVA